MSPILGVILYQISLIYASKIESSNGEVMETNLYPFI